MKTKALLYSCLIAFAICSSAYSQNSKKITMLHTSDTHSRIEPIEPDVEDQYSDMGGYVRRVTALKELRKENPNLLLFDCGDFSQGTPYYNMFRGEVEIELMNLMHYDAVLIGNHEFDFGIENLAKLFKMANFPVICSNYNIENPLLKGLVKPYIILERDGLKIGVMGVAPKLEGLVQVEKYEGVVYESPVEAGNKVAAILKKEEKCDVVICLSHLGITMDEHFMTHTNNIDVVLGGHSHTLMDKPIYYINTEDQKVPLLHTGKNGVFIGELNLTLERK